MLNKIAVGIFSPLLLTAIALFVVRLCHIETAAQVSTGQIPGTVKDALGGALPVQRLSFTTRGSL